MSMGITKGLEIHERPHYETTRFRSLNALRLYCDKHNLRLRKTTASKTNVYYKVLSRCRGIGIVGCFNEKPGTGRGTGHVTLSP